MSQFFQIHPDNPQKRLIAQAAQILREGGVIAYPTDSAYALGCHLDDKAALEKIRRIRQLDEKHNFTLVCSDLSQASTYARFDNHVFRLIKNHTPGAFTFILPATGEVPRRLQHPKRKTVGLRIPANNIALDLLAAHGEPIMSVSLILPGDSQPMLDPYDIRETLEHEVDLVIDGGYCGLEATTVIDLSGDEPSLIRQGVGDASAFGL
jgi:tRNA threonylcarbamoyl adenosine modification protein (Sua5/YciO/YrdC/YwlC family)